MIIISTVIAATLSLAPMQMNQGDETEAIGVATVMAIRGCAVSATCRKVVGKGVRWAGTAATGVASSAAWDGVKIVWGGWWNKDPGGPVRGQSNDSND